MISYAITVLSILGATLIPAYITLYAISYLKPIHIRYIAALGLGLGFWFFFDTFRDATDLDSSLGFTGGFAHVGLVVVFLAGITALALFDYFAVPRTTTQNGQNASGGAYSKSLILIPIAVAAVMGIHSMGEGWDFASVAAQSSTSSIVDAFGGYQALVSYPLHKLFEAAIIAAVYSCYIGRNDKVRKAKWHIPVLGLLFGFTSVIGAAIGYYISVDTSYLFAFGVTSAFYAIIRLVEPISLKFRSGETVPLYLGGKVFLAMAIGFFLLYTAAMLHA
jgi:hypothetical protein